ncbi:MAG: integrase arm-type DNA-binding domain-containing protein [Lysobacteraceae bacterium]
MPKQAKELSPLAVGRHRTPGNKAVGGVAGLMMQVSDSGARSWILRVSINGKRREIGLGSCADVSLADARVRAREIRSQIAAGNDPLAERRAKREKRGMTFAECAKALVESRSHGWKNPKHHAQWLSTLETYALPTIGALDVAKIELPHIVGILQPIWATKTETASRVRSRIEAVLSWATVSKHRSGDNPARWRGNLDVLFARPSKVSKVVNQPALGIEDVQRFMALLAQRDGASLALQFAILTATRSAETRLMRWGEVDLHNAIWTVPPERMKSAREHVVPLSPQALSLLNAQAENRTCNASDLVFPAPLGGSFSDGTLARVIRLMDDADIAAGGAGFRDKRQGRVAVPHGFRSTFRDWAAERTNFPNHVAEAALAHVIGDKTEAAYRRGDLLAKRRELMHAWAMFACPSMDGTNVVHIAKRAKP